MKPMTKLMLVFSIFFYSLPICANEITLNEIISKMEESEKRIESVQFEFTQEISYTITGEKQSNSGEAIYQKPDCLYMKHKNPLEQVIISNGKKVWIYTPSYNQVLVDNWKKWTSSSMVPASMINFGQNLNDLKKKYTFNYAGREDNKYVLLLVPQKKEQWQLKLWIEPESFIPSRASLSGENITITTQTRNFKVNPKLDKGMFNFQAPKGVDVLNLP